MWTAIPALRAVTNLADPSAISSAPPVRRAELSPPSATAGDEVDRHDTIPAPPWLGEASDPSDQG